MENPKDIELMSNASRLDIARSFINCEELFKSIIYRIKGNEEILIEDCYYDFVDRSEYLDKRIMNNKVYHDNIVDYLTDTEDEFESDGSDEWDFESYETDETDESEEESDNFDVDVEMLFS